MRQFSMLIKPASSLCNMRCRYCFYCDEAANRDVPSFGIMTRETAHRVIDRALEAVQTPTAPRQSATVSFLFQGGEPTMAGLDFFRDFTDYAKKCCPGGVELHYAIQTNGLVIDESWGALFREYGFLVGVSLDATPSLHDFCRPDAEGHGTYKRVLTAAKLLDGMGVDVNLLSVVTAQMAKHPTEVWNALAKSGFGYVQLIPCLAPLDGAEDAYTLTPALYAGFHKQLFRLWYEAFCRGQYLSVRQFDNLVRMAQGQPAEQCGMHGFCSPQFVIEADGGVYPCDFYALDPYRCGSVQENSMDELLHSPAMQDFLKTQEPSSPLCSTCRVKGFCGGGCRRYRSFYRQDPAFCPYQDFLLSTIPMLKDIVRRLQTK